MFCLDESATTARFSSALRRTSAARAAEPKSLFAIMRIWRIFALVVRRKVSGEALAAESDALRDALAAELRFAQVTVRINVRAWAQRAGITQDSLYRVFRSGRPVSVVELVMLCRAIEVDAEELLARAIQRAGQSSEHSRTAEVVRADRARLALEAAGLHSDLDDAFQKSRMATREGGGELSRNEWGAFLNGTATRSTATAMSSVLEVPVDYLTGESDDIASSRVVRELKFARSMREIGVTRLAARSLDELAPDEIHAVESAIREFIRQEEGT